jgi:asparagine synthase (glutamine-hydrolysing)
VQLVTAKCGGTNNTLGFSREIAWNSVDDVVEAVGRPLLGQDIIAQYHIYKLARQSGITAVIDGQGADEMLGGLPIYEAQMFIAMLKRLQLMRILRELRLRSRRYNNDMISNFRTYLASPLRTASRGRRRVYDWISAEWKAPAISKGCDEGLDPSYFNRFVYCQVKHQNLPTVIEQLDHTSMRHAVEARVPYLDHRVVELCFQLPAHFKIENGCRKKLLHDVARAYLPQAVLNRTDKKMFVSNTRWMRLREGNRDNLLDMAKSAVMRDSGLFDAKHLLRFVEGYLRNQHDDELAIWRLYTAYRWIEVCDLF